jgi:hypothetical protein
MIDEPSPCDGSTPHGINPGWGGAGTSDPWTARSHAPVSRRIAEYGRDTARIWPGPGVSGHESRSSHGTELNLRAAGSMLSPLDRTRRGEVGMGFATPPSLIALRSSTQVLRTLRMFRSEISANCEISKLFRFGSCCAGTPGSAADRARDLRAPRRMSREMPDGTYPCLCLAGAR